MQNTVERDKVGKKASYIAISGNIFLTIFNLIIGLLSGSTALVAEAFHTLSDVITSIIAFIGFKIGMRPADEEHQYGHGRAEPIVGLIIVFFLVVVAYEIISGAYIKIFLSSSLTPPDWIAAGMALIGIFVNYIMTTYLLRTGKKINSPALIADGNHQKVDIFSCTAVLIGVTGAQMGLPILDPIIAVIIALFIINVAYQMARDNINTLMGKIPSKELIEDIKKVALTIECVKDVHNVKINNMGPYVVAELHIVLNKKLDLERAHQISHEVEDKIKNNIKQIKMVTVHTEPVDVKCKKNSRIK